jgi:hypothetical protein
VEPRLLSNDVDDDDDEHDDIEQEEHHRHHHHATDTSEKVISSMPAGVEPHIQVIESHVDLQEFLAAGCCADEQGGCDDRLVMIKFHAAW